jgi:hypothetical protein
LTKFKARVQAIRLSAAPMGLCAHTYNVKAISVTSYVAQLVPLPRKYGLLERVLFTLFANSISTVFAIRISSSLGLPAVQS